MEPLKLSEIAVAVNGTCPNLCDIEINEISTDSRSIPKASLFVALRGERFDGNRFVGEAFIKGAAACIAEKNSPFVDKTAKNLILVEDTGKALLDIANLYRNKLSIKLVGVTGSVGKTTTKEMIYVVLSERFNTHKTQGNLNNQIGLPKTLLQLDKSFEAAVIEMGMSDLGEIHELSMCAVPDISVITTIGVSHLENLGTRENILKAKLEITDGMSASSPLVINTDNDMLSTVKLDRPIITYGIEKKADVMATDIESDGENTSFSINGVRATIPCIGVHNVYNALAAYAIAKHFDMTDEEIVRGLKNYTPSGMRQRITKVGDTTVVEDCYNASPDSVTAALKALASMTADGKKIAVLGDMLELGTVSKQGHFDAGKLCAELHIDELVCLGNEAKEYERGCSLLGGKATWFEDREELANYLIKTAKQGDVLWFKASRGMKFEELIEKYSKGK